eukprot:scaffold189017_cov29-Tisochrysis_lutea.AAC.1
MKEPASRGRRAARLAELNQIAHHLVRSPPPSRSLPRSLSPAKACRDRTNCENSSQRIEDRLIKEGAQRAERRRAAWIEREEHELDGATFQPSIDPLSSELARAQRERMLLRHEDAEAARERANELLVRMGSGPPVAGHARSKACWATASERSGQGCAAAATRLPPHASASGVRRTRRPNT